MFSSDILRNVDPVNKHLIGKRIKFKSDKKEHAGICEFIGINPLHGQYQVTINRCPIWPVDKETIKEIV